MANEKIQVKILCSPTVGKDEFYYRTFQVPLQNMMSVSNVLQYINENLDGGLAFYMSCQRGLCRGCLVRVNNRPVFACTHLVSGDIVVEPLDKTKVIRDLVIKRQEQMR
jgi:succinate dehydrogenase/fumarate reductase-like Fe-S protein